MVASTNWLLADHGSGSNAVTAIIARTALAVPSAELARDAVTRIAVGSVNHPSRQGAKPRWEATRWRFGPPGREVWLPLLPSRRHALR